MQIKEKKKKKRERERDFSCSLVSKEFTFNAGDPASIPGMERSPGQGNDNPLPYSFLENPMDRGAWQATVHGVARVTHDLATKPLLPKGGGGAENSLVLSLKSTNI